MSKILVALYDSPLGAKNTLQKMKTPRKARYKDACAVLKDRDGSLSLTQTKDRIYDPVIIGLGLGALAGVMLGYLLWEPAYGFLIGSAFGTAFGALWGGLMDYGINDDVIQRLATSMEPESSALFLLFKGGISKKTIEGLAETGATIIHTPVRDIWEDALREKIRQLSETRPEKTLPVYEIRLKESGQYGQKTDRAGKDKKTPVQKKKEKDEFGSRPKEDDEESGKSSGEKSE